MFNQRGIVNPIVALGVLLILGAFYVGALTRGSLVNDIKEQFEERQSESSSSAETQDVPSSSGIQTTTSYQSSPGAARDNYISSTGSDRVIVTGTQTLGERFYKLQYTFNFPKNGGEVTGTVTGTCEGVIAGSAKQPDSNRESVFTGNFEGKCQPIPGLSFKTNANGKFDGIMFQNSGQIQIIYEMQKPYSTRGSFNLSYNP